MTNEGHILETPGFLINPNDVMILGNCLDFRESIRNLFNNCTKEVYATSLYFGTDSTTIDCFKLLAQNKNPLKIHLLSDYSRSLRQDGNCMKIMEVFEKYGSHHKIDFYLFSANGSNIDILPPKMREIYGVQHMKFLIFDDTIIITGANISKTYLTDRQDRYYIIRNSPKLKQFIISCFTTITKFCHKLINKQLIFDKTMPCNNNMNVFTSMLGNDIINIKQSFSDKCDLTLRDFLIQKHDKKSKYVIIFPLLQFGKSNLFYIDVFIKIIMEELRNIPSSVYLTSAYINFDKDIKDTIFKTASDECNFHVVIPNPKSNSFYQSGFLMNHISGMYTLYIKNLVKEYFMNTNIKLYEYLQLGNTYHAKGIWIDPKDTNEPFFTLLGSSNLNQRSTFRDLELNFAIFSTDESFSLKMRNEALAIIHQSNTIDGELYQKSEYNTPFLCYLLKYIMSSYF